MNPNEGLAGARRAIEDSRPTGRALRIDFELEARRARGAEEVVTQARELAASGIRFVLLDLHGAELQAAANALPADTLLFNIRDRDEALRNESCRRNLLHTAVTNRMLADGLAQYLIGARSWRRWLLIVGPLDADRALAREFRAAAERFGGSIVGEIAWRLRFGAGRTDTGHVTLQSEIPVVTRGPDHDVLVVADTGDAFGAHLEGRTAAPRPIAGTHGIVATAWSSVTEAFGAGQLQRRFERAENRPMRSLDYAAWLAVRSIAEAAAHVRSARFEDIARELRSPDLMLGGYKGQGMSFREWDGQLRQPILIVGARVLISVSPQPGYLHRRTVLDTLGTDREESRCAP